LILFCAGTILFVSVGRVSVLCMHSDWFCYSSRTVENVDGDLFVLVHVLSLEPYILVSVTSVACEAFKALLPKCKVDCNHKSV